MNQQLKALKSGKVKKFSDPLFQRHVHNSSQGISQPCMIGFVTWPPFTYRYIDDDRWPSDKANHAWL